MARRLIQFPYYCPNEGGVKIVTLLEGCFVHEGTAFMGLKLECNSCKHQFQDEILAERNINTWKSEASDFHL